jgi:hypothetical protein
MEPFTTVELCTGRVGATPPNAIERYPRVDASGADLDGLRRGLRRGHATLHRHSRSSRSLFQDGLTNPTSERFLAS